ncbi:MAG: saccharopine dehydrogenase NADP-binding domain-containing protein [Candidatus Bathyarchaeota archaeon]|nr:saccharopine dehydrogenase NADP-binding domain-containing protein [Candidatus Bathyarchaeota archaeon]
MKVLILGGAGSMALATIRDFLEFDSSEVSELVIADISYEKVKKRADELPSQKVSPAFCDVTDYANLVKLMKGHDVVIDETNIPGVLRLKAALEAGVHIIDLGTWSKDTLEQLKLDGEFEKAGLTAILGLGSSPGITNLYSRYIVDKLDTAESIHLSFAYAESTKATLFVPFAGAIEEFTNDVMIFQDGKHVELPPQSGQEDARFPDPIGVRRLMYVPHPEVATFPIYFKEKEIKNVSVKAGFVPEFVEKINFLIDLGLLSREPMKVKDTTVVPEDIVMACISKLPQPAEQIDYGCTRAVIKGEKSGEKLEYTAELFSHPYPGLTGVQHRTGHSPAIGARMIKRGEIKRRGVFPPEVGINPKKFFKELARRGLDVYYSVKHFI